MDDSEIYKTFCEPRFRALDRQLDDIHKVICGNGKEGLADTVRNHGKLFNRIFWAIGVMFVAGVTAVIGGIVSTVVGIIK